MSLHPRYAPPVEGQPPSQLQPTIFDDSKQLEIDRILDSKLRYRKLHFLAQWAGYRHIYTSWEPAEYLENVERIVDEFH